MSEEDLLQLMFDSNTVISLDPDQLKSVQENFDFLASFSSDKIIYGINTGFGPMAQYIVPHSDRQQLQLNLIRSHAAGMGEALSVLDVKATAIARLNSLMQARSGVHPDTIILLKDMINAGIYPVLYKHGGVGASGDLVQLAHLALGMIGEGHAHYKGEVVSAADALAGEGLEPMRVHFREGLALMNGTSAMTGIGLLNSIYAQRLLAWSIRLSSMINEIVQAFDDHLSELLQASKKHPGQIAVAHQMRTLLEGSGCIKSRVESLYNKSINGDKLSSKLQEYYSIRCVPQILGPIMDTLQNVKSVLEAELNSSSDNPVILDDSQEILHGGNFHGDYVSFEMDKLKIAIAKLSMLAERQLNFLLNDKLNEKLPPFLNMGRLGFNFGLQGIQFTATSTTAENQTLSNPMYVHSIPSNNDNQDIVSMGANAAIIARQVVENAFDVLAIEALTVVRAITHLDISDKMAPATREFFDQLHNPDLSLQADQSLQGELNRLKSLMKSSN